MVQLIAASIVSKKLVGGASGFVFDVKCGSGAFMETEDKARELAASLSHSRKNSDAKASPR